MRRTLQIVVVGILSHASVEERPRQVVNCILFVLDGPSHNLSIEMIVQTMIQMRLDTIRQQHSTSSLQLLQPAATTASSLQLLQPAATTTEHYNNGTHLLCDYYNRLQLACSLQLLQPAATTTEHYANGTQHLLCDYYNRLQLLLLLLNTTTIAHNIFSATTTTCMQQLVVVAAGGSSCREDAVSYCRCVQ